MKIKAPKPWQITVIIVMAFVLAVVGSVLAVYFTTGFGSQNIYPESIAIEVDAKDNGLGQYEVDKDFSFVVNTETESVTEKEVRLSFPNNTQVYKGDDIGEGNISDGRIIIPEKAVLGQTIPVKLYDKYEYTASDGSKFTSYKAGVSTIEIRSANSTDEHSEIEVAVDVPVHEIVLRLANTSMPKDDPNRFFKMKDDKIVIAQNSHIEVVPEFYPAESKYLFSDGLNSKVAEADKRTRSIFVRSNNNNDIQFVYNDGDPYFIAKEITAENALEMIEGYVFTNANDQLLFEQSEYIDEPLYNDAFSWFASENIESVSAKANFVIQESTISTFSVNNNTSSNHMQMTVNKPFRLFANEGQNALNLAITDNMGIVTTSVYGSVGIMITSVTDLNGNELIKNDAPASKFVTIEGAADGKTLEGYTLMNTSVKDLRQAYFTLSTNGEYKIKAKVVLFVQESKGNHKIFTNTDGEEVYGEVYIDSREGVSNPVKWADGKDQQIDIKILYEDEKLKLTSYSLKDMVNIPAENAYQDYVFFVYPKGVLSTGKKMSDYVEIAPDGSGTYSFVNETLYPLSGDSLDVKDALEFNLLFATVRTDANGDRYQNEDGTFIIDKYSEAISVSVNKSLRSPEKIVFTADKGFEHSLNGLNLHVIPTRTAKAVTLTITFREGDLELFQEEYNKKNIRIYASEDHDGNIESNILSINGAPTYDADSRTATFIFDVGMGNPELTDYGKDYFITVNYFDSYEHKIWSAADSNNAGLDEGSDTIRVYKQVVSSITNKDLADKTLNVVQKVTTENDNELEITLVGETTSLNGWSDVDSLLTATTMTDIYGKEFKDPGYTIVTNSDIITPSTDGKSIRVATSGNASTRVEVRANGSKAKFAFNVVAQSIGVQRIEVNGTEMTQNPSYVTPGLKETELKLKESDGNLFKIILADGKEYKNYHVNIVTELDSDLKEMLEITNEDDNPQYVKSIKIKNSFGRELILPLNVFNEAKTIDFTFTIRLTPAVQFYENKLNEINYGNNVTGVKGKDNKKTYVYAEYDLPFTNHFKYSEITELGSGVWSATSFEPQYVSGDVTWEKNKKTLKFSEVYTEETKTITLYAIAKENGSGGNEYGFKYELSLVVCPNFELSATKSFSMIEFKKTESELSLGDYVSLKRVTGENAQVTLNGVTYATEEGSSIKIEKTSAGSGFNIAFDKTLNLGFGEKYALTTINLLYDGDVIASCKLRLDCGISSETLHSSGNTWLANLVRYDGIQRVLIPSTIVPKFTTITSNDDVLTEYSDIQIIIVGNNKNYTISSSDGALMFNSATNSINVGDDFYLNVHIKAVSDGDETTYVILQIPYIYSRVGEDFAIYDNDYYTNDKYFEDNQSNLASVADLEALLEETDSSIDVNGGEDYYLIAPETLMFGNKTYYYTFDESGNIKLNEVKESLATTEAKASGSNDVDGYTITFETFSRKNGSKKVLKSFTAKKDKDEYKVQVLTGLSKEYLNGIKITFANNSHEYLNVDESGKLTISNFIGKSGEALKSAVAITFTSADSLYSKTQNFNLDIRPNGGECKLQEVVYPNNGNVEFAEAKEDKFELDLAGVIPEEAINNGQYRFPDKLTNGKSVTATMAVSHIYVAGVENSNGVNAQLEGTKLTVTGVKNVKDIEIVLTRTFSDVYTMKGEKATQEYRISLNETGDKEYYINVNSASWTGSNGNELVKDSSGNYILTLSRAALGKDVTLNTTTRVRTSRGEADAVETTVMSSTLEKAKPENSDIKDNLQNGENNQFKFKIEGFVNTDFTFDLHFTVRGQTVKTTIHVKVPSSVDIKLKTQLNLHGGQDDITAEQIVDITTQNVTITKIEVVEGDNFDIKDPKNQFWTTTDAVDESPAKISFHDMLENRKIKLKFSYDYKESADDQETIHKGYFITPEFPDYIEVESNVSIADKVQWKPIKKEREGFTSTENFVTTNILKHKFIEQEAEGFTTGWTSRATSSPYATAAVDFTNKNITITPNYVSKTETADFTITFIYTNGSYTFEKTVNFTMTVSPAARLEVHYPNPEGASETLDRESIKAGDEYESFLTGKALFADSNRFTDSITDTDVVITETNQLSAKVVKTSQGVTLKKKDNNSFVNVDTTIAADDTIKAELTNVSSGTITLEVTYKGSVKQYELFVTNNLITSIINKTNHYNGSTETETIYADTLNESGMFNSERLLEIKVPSQAPVDTTYYVYLVDGNENDTLLTSFKLTSELRQANVIYVDWGGNVDVSVLKSAFGNAPTHKFEFRTKDGTVYSDFTVERLAGRVELHYSTADGSSVRIAGDKIDLGAALPSGVTATNTGNASYTISPKRSEAEEGENTLITAFSYKISRQLDFVVEHNYTKDNGVIAGNVVVGESEKIKFVETAGLKRASNGEVITAEEVKRSKITMRLNVVNVAEDKSDWLSVTGGKGKQFKYRTKGEYANVKDAKEYDYLNTFGIEVQDDNDSNKKYPYDFYFYALGCANDGDYVLVQLIYTCNQVQSAEYYFAYHIIPGYNVKIDNKIVATAGNLYEDSVTNGAGSPYESNGKTGNDEVQLPLTGDGGLIKVSLTHHSSNTERSQAFKITITENDEALYNSSDNMAKLAKDETNGVGTWAWPVGSSSPKVYSWHSTNKYNATSESNKAVLKWNSSAAFGEKRYKAVLTDQYGYEIDFYFTLAPTERQNPKADYRSDTVFNEEDKFDVGAIYDLITIQDGKASTTFSQTPNADDATLKKLYIEGINGAYGYANAPSDGIDKKNLNESYIGNTKPFFKVKLNSITFKYVDEVNHDETSKNPIGDVANTTLATKSSLQYAINGESGGKVKFSSENSPYRNMEGKFTVPTMPGWIYNGGTSANITIVVELKYSASENDSETYAVQFNATINKKSNIVQKSHVVVDGEGFNPKGYIGVGTNNSDLAAVYDDTLAVTIPQGAQVRLGVKLGNKEIYPFTTAPLGNGGSLGRAETKYNLSLSNMSVDYLKDPSKAEIKLRLESTLPDAYITFSGTSYKADTKIITIGGNTFKLDGGSISGNTVTYPTLKLLSDNSDGKTATDGTYNDIGGKSYTARMESIGASEYKLTLTPTDVNDTNVYTSVFAHISENSLETVITPKALGKEKQEGGDETYQDVLYLEDNGVDFVGNKDSGQYHLVTKTYVVQVGDEANVKYYLHSQNFFVTRAYTYFDDGAGLAQQLHIKGYSNDANNYLVQQADWTSGVHVYTATDNAAKDGLTKSTSGVALNDALNGDHIYAKVTDEEGNPTAATIENGVLKINKQNYTPGENQYLQIRLYVKVSGGPGKSSDKQWQKDEGNDFEIGTYMVVLDAAAEVTSGSAVTLSNYLPSADKYFNNLFEVAGLSAEQTITLTLNGKDGSDLRTDTISANSNYQLAANSTQAATIFGSGFSIQALSSTSGAKIIYNGTTMTLNVRVLRMDNGDLYLVGYEYTPPVTSEAGEVTAQAKIEAKNFSDFDFTSTFPTLIKISNDGTFGEAISITKVEEVVEGEAAADDESDGGEKVVTYYYDLDGIHVTVEKTEEEADWSDLLFKYEHESPIMAGILYTFTPWSVAQEKGGETFPENANKQGWEFASLSEITTDTITTSEESIDRYYVLKNGTTYTPITKTYTVKQST